MTRNQISYQELLEKKRANLAQEAETARANAVREAQNAESLAIAKENVALGYANQANQLEIARTNAAASYYAANMNYSARQAEVALGYQQLEQTKMSSARDWLLRQSNLGYQYEVLNETQRSNQARETETQRHNMATEATANTANVINTFGSLVKVADIVSKGAATKVTVY